MKRILFCLTFAVAIFLNLSAQIQREFFGFALAESHKNEIVRYFEAQDKEISNLTDKTIFVTNINFGGHKWPFVSFSFNNGVLYEVYFADNDGFTRDISLNTTWNYLKRALFDKYSNFLDSYNSGEETKIFDDKRTKIKLEYSSDGLYKQLTLSYYDKKLIPRIKNRSKDEL